MTKGVDVDLITVCEATTREFRFLRIHQDQTASDVFNATLRARASARVCAFYDEMLSPTPKRA